MLNHDTVLFEIEEHLGNKKGVVIIFSRAARFNVRCCIHQRRDEIIKKVRQAVRGENIVQTVIY